MKYSEIICKAAKTQKAVIKDFQKQLKKHNLHLLTLEESVFLIHLSQIKSDNITPQSVAAQGMQMVKYLNFIINILESKKLISITCENNDHRKILISLTKEGKQFTEIIDSFPVSKELLNEIMVS